jgi:hypothetical protein
MDGRCLDNTIPFDILPCAILRWFIVMNEVFEVRFPVTLFRLLSGLPDN